ncbi:hypothetical protein F444_07608 [Phytophthora nicotianae P1976]|uniref:Uncharacterized protein n=1 Tax=Phytophthora nicotianae P1976 TaxID=1317066 RepID=A0A081AE51_PHYNI|nr:hypothetical protein F444_07608 [Phytophthora nicotianae P1976]
MEKLRGRILYRSPETEEAIWAEPKRLLEVYIPARCEDKNVERQLSSKEGR